MLGYSIMHVENYTKICSDLEKVRIGGNPYWNAGPETIQYITSCIAYTPHCRVLEVGTSNGYTALRLAPALIEVFGTMVTIESHAERSDSAEQNIQFAGIGDVVTLVRGHAPEVFHSLQGTFDLVFLDATKYEHTSYVAQLLEYFNERTIIIADNVLSHAEALSSFVAYMYSLPGFSVEILDIETGLLVAKKHTSSS